MSLGQGHKLKIFVVCVHSKTLRYMSVFNSNSGHALDDSEMFGRYVHIVQKMCWIQYSETQVDINIFEWPLFVSAPYLHQRILKVFGKSFLHYTRKSVGRKYSLFCIYSLYKTLSPLTFD